MVVVVAVAVVAVDVADKTVNKDLEPKEEVNAKEEKLSNLQKMSSPLSEHISRKCDITFK